MEKKTERWIIIFLPVAAAVSLVAFLIYLAFYSGSFFSNQEVIRRYIDAFGVWAPLGFISLQVLQVVITPLAQYPVGMTGGFLFGPVLGFIYNYIGRILGNLIAFSLARAFGRPFAEKFIKPKTLLKYDKFWEKGGTFLLFLFYYLPLPSDEMSYIAGASRMRVRSFLIANLLGQIGGSLTFAYLGSGFEVASKSFWIIFVTSGVLALFFSLIWWEKYRFKFSQSK